MRIYCYIRKRSIISNQERERREFQASDSKNVHKIWESEILHFCSQLIFSIQFQNLMHCRMQSGDKSTIIVFLLQWTLDSPRLLGEGKINGILNCTVNRMLICILFRLPNWGNNFKYGKLNIRWIVARLIYDLQYLCFSIFISSQNLEMFKWKTSYGATIWTGFFLVISV